MPIDITLNTLGHSPYCQVRFSYALLFASHLFSTLFNVVNSIATTTFRPPTDVQFTPLTKEFIDLINNETLYNRYATPTQYSGTATNVSMSMYIEGISSFSAQTMDYHLDMYFYQEWYDDRLRHNSTGPMLVRDKALFKKLWRPDVYFANARHASFQDVTEDNFCVWIYPSGRVWYDCRISLVAICMMNLWKYPLDSQECSLRILSYAYPETQLRLRWSSSVDPPIDRNAEIRMPDMRLVDIKMGTCNGTYVTGTWSCMTAVFMVQREMLHHVVQTYVPTALIVVISWFNFWLDIDSAPARVSLSITTLLTIATQANAVKLALPEVSYMKAIDVWMGMCMTFVFGVMVEYTIAHYAKNQEMSRIHPPNLIVDSTLSTLFGTNSTTNSAQTANDAPMPLTTFHQMTPVTVPRRSHPAHKVGVRHSVGNPTGLNHSDSAYCNHRPLRPDEPDLHTIRMRNSIAHHDTSYSDEDDDEIAAGYEECETDLHNMFITDYLKSNNVNQNHITENHQAGNSIHKHNSFSGNTVEARLRIPAELHADGALMDKFDEDSIQKLEARKRLMGRHSVSRLRHQVSRQAQSMKSNVQALCNLRGRAMADKIDQKSRVVFPLAFIIVNIFYWSFYLIFN